MIASPRYSLLWPRLRWPLVVSLVLGSFFGIGISAHTARGESNDAIARKIIAAWKRRQDRIRTVRAEVVEDCGVKEKVFGQHISPSQEPVSYSTSKVTTVIFDFARNRQRYEVRGGIYNTTLGRVVEQERITVLRNGERKTFTNSPTFPKQGLSAAGYGVVSAAKDYSPMVGKIYPLLWYVHPLGSDVPGVEAFEPRDFRVIRTARSSASDLIECGSHSDSDLRVWVDPRRDYVVVRVSGMRQETTVTYTRGKHFRVVPNGWTLVLLGPDRTVRQSFSCRIRKLKLNEALDDSLFELTFPEGAIVDDIGGRGISPTMVATGKGGLRALASHEQPVTRSVWRWFLWCNLLFVLMLAAFLLYRKTKYAT